MKLQNFMAAKLKGNLLALLRDARLISITKHLKLRFRAEKKYFGFRKLLRLVWTLAYVFHRSHAAASFGKQMNNIRSLNVLFVKKLL